MSLAPDSVFHRDMPACEPLNTAVLAQFARHVDDEDVKRTHLFGGRYENLYLGLDKVPALAAVIDQAKRHAAGILGSDRPLQVGFWFNRMGPGHATTAHTHDDDDELLSGVYYIDVPANSGELLLHTTPPTRISPQAGQFVFFSPSLLHEVTPNHSTHERLSIGMNFGPAD